MRILMPSIVDPDGLATGAGTVTKGLLRLLGASPLGAQAECVPLERRSPALHRLRQISSLARSLVSELPSKVTFAGSRRLLRRIERLLESDEFGAIVLNGSDLLWLRDSLPQRLPRVLVALNIEHLLFASQIRSASYVPRPLRWMLERDCRRLEEYEMRGLGEVKNVLFLSSEDAAYATDRCPDLNAVVVPPVFGCAPAPRAPREGAGPVEVGFLGNLNWWPNREGLRWFLTKVFPKAGEGIRLNLFGQGSEAASRGHPRIVGHGRVADLARVWSRCDFMICPIFSGGGVCVKLAEALYNGVPVLGSTFAKRGLPVEEGAGLVLLDRAEDWVAFLRSPGARALGRTRIKAEVSARFALEPYRGAMLRLFACGAPASRPA